MASDAEWARSATTWRIRSAIKKIRAAHPRLGQHLANSIRTGVLFVYPPETPVNWALWRAPHIVRPRLTPFS